MIETKLIDMVDKFESKFWNGSYWARGKFSDGATFELKSKDDLTYNQWQEKIKAAWEDHIKPELEPDERACPKCKATFVCENRA